MKRVVVLWAVFLSPALWAQQAPVQECVLPNGFRLLMIPRKGDPNVAAGWLAKAGSVHECPGITGLSHLFEHMIFKWTHGIGTTDIQKDLALMIRLDAVKEGIRKEEQVQLRRLRLVEISDLQDPKNRTARHNELLREFAGIEKESKSLIILLNPVFRDFYSERDVVFEERRMRTDSTPEAAEPAICREIEKLQKEKVSEHELQKVKNQFAADNYRRLESRFFLMLQILLADSNRGGQSFNEDPKRIAAVTAEDIQRVANLYFKPENRTVALYDTKKAEEGAEDPLLRGLSDQEKVQVHQFREAVVTMSLDEAEAIMHKLEAESDSAPPDRKIFVDALRKLLQAKIQNGGK